MIKRAWCLQSSRGFHVCFSFPGRFFLGSLGPSRYFTNSSNPWKFGIHSSQLRIWSRNLHLTPFLRGTVEKWLDWRACGSSSNSFSAPITCKSLSCTFTKSLSVATRRVWRVVITKRSPRREARNYLVSSLFPTIIPCQGVALTSSSTDHDLFHMETQKQQYPRNLMDVRSMSLSETPSWDKHVSAYNSERKPNISLHSSKTREANHTKKSHSESYQQPCGTYAQSFHFQPGCHPP